ncbi:MAG: class I SAM-dependent methyltransferase [Spirochaetales bacterium]|nr:class I SAM-dependent methyltransferase [Spirochaetales bacterium]
MKTALAAKPDNRRSFFDRKADTWDSRIRDRDYYSIEQLFKRVNFRSSDYILDVGSGTGIMIPFYLKNGIQNINAIDNSEKMVNIFKKKFPDINVLCRCFLSPMNESSFADKIIIFNTFPHFENFDLVFANSARYLRKNGRLIIAHSMNRREIEECHQRKSPVVAKDLLPADRFFQRKFTEYAFKQIVVEESESGFFAMGSL